MRKKYEKKILLVSLIGIALLLVSSSFVRAQEAGYIETCHVTKKAAFMIRGVKYVKDGASDMSNPVRYTGRGWKDSNNNDVTNPAIPIDCGSGTFTAWCVLDATTGSISSHGDCNGTPACKLVPYAGYGVACIMNAIAKATDWIFAIVLAIAIIFIIWGAFTLVTAGGSPEKALKGRNYIIYAVVGFIVALLAKAIPGIAKWFLTG